jgi:hypothetical protein
VLRDPLKLLNASWIFGTGRDPTAVPVAGHFTTPHSPPRDQPTKLSGEPGQAPVLQFGGVDAATVEAAHSEIRVTDYRLSRCGWR